MTKIDYKKIVSIICFNLISLSILISFGNQAKGYELSIYEYTSYFVWIILVISISGGVTIIIHQVYTKEYKSSNFWLVGFLILILSRITLLYIPYMRGYYTWNGDNITHIGYIKDILFTGHISADNSYPIIHIFLTELIYISGASIESIANHSTALLSVFYVVSIYLLSRMTLHMKDEQLLAVAAIGGVIFNVYDVYITPNGWSILYMPFVFFLFFKSLIKERSAEYKSLLLVMLVLFPFFHPLSSVILIIMLLTIGFIKYLIHVVNYKKLSLRNILYFCPIDPILIVSVIFLQWTLSFPKFNINLRGLFDTLIKGHSSGQTAIVQMGQQLNKINIHGLDFVNLTLKIMGHDIIFLALSIIAAVILFKNQEERKNNNMLIIMLGITFILGMMYSMYLFNIIPGLNNIGADRLIAYTVIFTPISAGFVLKRIMEKKYIYVYVVICIIQVASINSLLGLYSSPYIVQPNIQVTRMDIYGAKWLIDYKNADIGNEIIMSPVERFADLILGTNKRTDLIRSPQFPDHFNYTVSNRLGESNTKDKYTLITQFDKQIYDTVWKDVGRFHKEDFEKLEIDRSLDKLYSNGDVTTWYIHSIQ